ncbi:MAG TPA: phospho-N-acetylmuramoyl-pentapeptide-transferase [Thermotogota bacterium]|nr:phospho-N-acetylmuramoyl-pentapeptide-transferase [Thermotogota bacterium]HPJ87686.1 phospho-N-acetylmuramoyl-pentapeptide-transferase [Thermotogota bacterium]HPR94875.1 phospho-N-acetylmuramoyl-pentapeptide-transferase [Thermotogota bacterium]
MFWSLLVEIITSLFLFAVSIGLFKKRGIVQYVRQEGPQLHNYKEGTPTAGGIIFMFIFIIFYIFSNTLVKNEYFLAVLLGTVFFGGIGLIDDSISFTSKHSKGLSAKGKFSLQIIFSIVIYLILLFSGIIKGTDIRLYHLTINLGWFYPVFFVLYLTMFSNAVNVTDGLDGLSGGCALITAAGIQIFLWLTGITDFSMMFLSGALLGFLWFNIKPASIFMGDTGALGLGGIFGIIALINGDILIISGLSLMFMIEILSVVIQVTSFKLFKRRVFRMSPIHHHFELKGWEETTVVIRFWLINIIGVVLSLILVLL